MCWLWSSIGDNYGFHLVICLVLLEWRWIGLESRCLHPASRNIDICVVLSWNWRCFPISKSTSCKCLLLHKTESYLDFALPQWFHMVCSVSQGRGPMTLGLSCMMEYTDMKMLCNWLKCLRSRWRVFARCCQWYGCAVGNASAVMNSITLLCNIWSSWWNVPGRCVWSSPRLGTNLRGNFCSHLELLISWRNIQKSSSLLRAAMACFRLLMSHFCSSSVVGHTSQLFWRSTGVNSYSLMTEFNICNIFGSWIHGTFSMESWVWWYLWC